MLVLTAGTLIKEINEFIKAYNYNQAQAEWMEKEVAPYYIYIIENMHREKKDHNKLMQVYKELKKMGGFNEVKEKDVSKD